ncbi:KAP family P-loop NTPase fold protein [Candidatus Poriferisocius sp.]|uniref:KAP family P-loop NTPase fold protein n=1 Tax=Candidatus Poriferisocius sp. TaxID=3101276 RepID=UPI003B02D5C9
MRRGDLQLRAPEFVVDADDPFANDRLNRQHDIKSFCDVIQNAGEHGAIILLDGQWGSGKTAFVKMATAHLQTQDPRVAEFNAWKQSHTEIPLADLVAAISTQIDKSKMKAVKKAAGNALVHVSKMASRGIVDVDAMKISKPEIIDQWEEIEKAVGEFRTQLQLAASSDNGPLVVIIDELDRCRPDYALKVLETVRHLFDVPGVVVVLAANLKELCHTVQSIYGPNFTADRYLRRFADQYVLLTKPDEQHLSEFLEHTLEIAGLHTRISAANSPMGTDADAGKVLQLAIEATGCSIRDLEQAIFRAVAPIASVEPGFHPRPSAPQPTLMIAALTTLQVIAPDAYRGIVDGDDDDGFAAIAAICKVLGKPYEDNINDWPFTPRGQLESILIAGMSTASSGKVAEISENISRDYQKATQCSDELAATMGSRIIGIDLRTFNWVRRLVCFRDYKPSTGEQI